MPRWMPIAVVFLTPALGCQETAAAKCQDMEQLFCEREIACGRQTDQIMCQDMFDAAWECDLEGSLATYDACLGQLEPGATECSLLLPDSCAEVLCSEAIGCDFQTTCGNGQEPPCEETPTPTSPTGSM